MTDSEGLRSWVPDLGIREMLKGPEGKILGYSSYRVFLYTVLIFVFSVIGFGGWYRTAPRGYRTGILLVVISGLYHITMILADLRRHAINGSEIKLTILTISFLIAAMVTLRGPLKLRMAMIWTGLWAMSLLPFVYDLVTDSAGSVRSWVPDLGVESFLTDSQGMVRGLRSYRLLLYLFGTYLFSHLGWLGWFMDGKGRQYRPFLLVPAALSLYQIIVILMSWRETDFNTPNIKLYITLCLAILLAVNFYYNNRRSGYGLHGENKTT